MNRYSAFRNEAHPQENTSQQHLARRAGHREIDVEDMTRFQLNPAVFRTTYSHRGNGEPLLIDDLIEQHEMGVRILAIPMVGLAWRLILCSAYGLSQRTSVRFSLVAVVSGLEP